MVILDVKLSEKELEGVARELLGLPINIPVNPSYIWEGHLERSGLSSREFDTLILALIRVVYYHEEFSEAWSFARACGCPKEVVSDFYKARGDSYYYGFHGRRYAAVEQVSARLRRYVIAARQREKRLVAMGL